ncbi:NnrU family protein [Thermopetrobacter sp. TC1]|uniref:NnrU family protein n=1 Tax=Thermopetrobacter sp. TC1 TaxID=1495045 RepID=UPI000570D4E8|nr:NnrU family protein [Thermopetrobacter sp. TC1]
MIRIILLALAIALFGITHAVPALPRLKARIKAVLGRAYLPLFIALSVFSTGAIAWLWATSPFIALYDPPPWGAHVTFLLMFFAFLLFGIFLYPCRLKRFFRLPFAYVVLLWGTGHLFANGDAATVVLAAGLMIVAAVLLALALKNGVRPEAKDGLSLDLAALLTGMILYVFMAMFHGMLIGVPVLHYIGIDIG